MTAHETFGDGHILVSGAPEGFDATLLAERADIDQGAVLHVARDDVRLAAMRRALAAVRPDLPVLSFPAWDCLPYDRVSPNADIAAARMAFLAGIATLPAAPMAVLTTLNAASQFLPPRELVRVSVFEAIVGKQLDIDALRSYLVRMGYAQAPTVTEPGDFAVRGGIVDIFPPGWEEPVRLDMFGDVLDGARQFDPVSQRTTRTVTRVDLAPASEVILDEPSITRFRQNYRVSFGAGGNDDPLYEAISAGRKHQGMEHWLGFFLDRTETLFDHVGAKSVILDDRLDAARAARAETIAEQYDARVHAMSERSALGSVYKPAPPETLYLDDGAWGAAMGQQAVRHLSVLPQSTGPGVLDAGGRVGRQFTAERQQENVSLFDALADHIAAARRSGNVVLASYSEGSRDRFQTLLEDAGVPDARPVDALAEITGTGGLYLIVWELDQGFTARDLTVISEQDVLGDRLIRAPRKRKRAENYLTEVGTLSPGDLVVHIEHGIGRYLGLETITAAGAPHECLALEYAEKAKLYLLLKTSSFCRDTAMRRDCSTDLVAAHGRRKRPD